MAGRCQIQIFFPFPVNCSFFLDSKSFILAHYLLICQLSEGVYLYLLSNLSNVWLFAICLLQSRDPDTTIHVVGTDSRYDRADSQDSKKMSWAKSGLAKVYKTDLKKIASADFTHEIFILSKQFIPGSPRMLFQRHLRNTGRLGLKRTRLH